LVAAVVNVLVNVLTEVVSAGDRGAKAPPALLTLLASAPGEVLLPRKKVLTSAAVDTSWVAEAAKAPSNCSRVALMETSCATVQLRLGEVVVNCVVGVGGCVGVWV
jgi:hypothetical protein